MVKRLHKWAGIISALWLFILFFTGLLLNHENNCHSLDFLWDIQIPKKFFSDFSIKKNKNRDITSYKIFKDNIFIGSLTGFYVNDKKILDKRVYKIEPYREKNKETYETLFLATDDGIYVYKDKKVYIFLLKGKNITSISVNYPFIYAVEDKKNIYKIDLNKNKIEKINLDLKPADNIKINRFVRDYHYGRGLFVNPYSAYLNDLFSVFFIFTIISGTILFFKKKVKKNIIKRISYKIHITKLNYLFFLFILLLITTGLLINRPYLYKDITRIEVPTSIFPPIYHNPEKDIWDIDFDGKNLRIGTRFGVYKGYLLETAGFAYKLRRIEDNLYISGMGGPNKVLKNGEWEILRIKKHMPIDFIKMNGKIKAISKKDIKLKRDRLPLYTFLLSFHDASIFGEGFLILNDIFSILSIFIILSGIYLLFPNFKPNTGHN